MKKGWFFVLSILVLPFAARCGSAVVAPTRASVDGGFWKARLETNRTATLEAVWRNCETTRRFANFVRAAAREKGTFQGKVHWDSDVYKLIDGIAWNLRIHPDPALEARVAKFVSVLAAAQEPDGYLYTARTLEARFDDEVDFLDRVFRPPYGLMGPTRWSLTLVSHEFYNTGHLIEAALSWREATGRDDLLAVARKAADLLCRTFGPAPGQLKGTSGHPEVELALFKLAAATGEPKYRNLALFLIDMRGRGDVRSDLGYPHNQDRWPVFQVREAQGHAVCAGYLYSAFADAAMSGCPGYEALLDDLWNDAVGRKTHLSGSIGSRAKNFPKGLGEVREGFGEAYDLPNEGSYLETCAAIANALWNERMFRLKREAKYVDLYERILYNGVLSGVSFDGTAFFYMNPLASKGTYRRSKWFPTSCCPPNVLRFLPQLPFAAFAAAGDVLYWNHFLDSTARIAVGGGDVTLSQRSGLPFDGRCALTVDPGASPRTFAVKVRVPGWARGVPYPASLYATKDVPPPVRLAVNGEDVPAAAGADGFVTVRRAWRRGDGIVLSLPMAPRRMRAREEVEADRGRVAVERGPLVYCVEGGDNGGEALDARLPRTAALRDEFLAFGDERMTAIRADSGLRFVPFAFRGNRFENSDSQTWVRETGTCVAAPTP